MESITIDYIKGWLDRQSQVNVSGRSIISTSSNEYLIRSIYAALLRLGIECMLNKVGARFELRIGRKTALIRYNEAIGFACRAKADKLNRILTSYSS